jgi:hypothetical protein
MLCGHLYENPRLLSRNENINVAKKYPREVAHEKRMAHRTTFVITVGGDDP